MEFDFRIRLETLNMDVKGSDENFEILEIEHAMWIT